MPEQRLNCDAVDCKPRDFDFSEGYTETWETIQPNLDNLDAEELEDELCGMGRGYDRDEDHDDEEHADALREALLEAIEDDPDTFAPAMNYAYPLPGYTGNADDLQAELMLKAAMVCAVLIGDDVYLALTGGGMDLSWEICRAYMVAGYYPPLHFCSLPRMAGRGSSDQDNEIIAACFKSAEIAANWARSKAADLLRLEEYAKESTP